MFNYRKFKEAQNQFAPEGSLNYGPNSGTSNLQLTNGEESMEGDDEELLQTLEEISNTFQPEQLKSFIPSVSKFVSQPFNTPGVNDELIKLHNALQLNPNPQQNTEGFLTPQEIAKRILEMFSRREQKMSFNLKQYQQREAYIQDINAILYNKPVYAEKENNSNDPQKKKTRGNPFRVLMGRVGKLLDHGMEKKDIVRHLHKKMNFFNEDTISKAVDIVKDYNRKKRTKPKTSFNLNDFIRTASRYDNSDIYSIEPDWEKRSTGELIARATWLKSLLDYSPTTKMGDGKKVADKEGASSELVKIRQALIHRGFDNNEIP